MADAWENLNKASREYQNNPTKANKQKLEKAEKEYQESQKDK